MGHSGYGCYGLNVGVGNIDDDPQRGDSRHLRQPPHPGILIPMGEALDASPWFTNPSSEYLGKRMTWGQFIRWCDPDVEENHYHLQ